MVYSKVHSFTALVQQACTRNFFFTHASHNFSYKQAATAQEGQTPKPQMLHDPSPLLPYLVASRPMHHHSRSNWQRGNWKNRDNHPVGPSILWVHAQNATVLVRDILEDLKDTLCCQHYLLILGIIISLLV